jgi:PAS domain S-box-containing protein
MVPITLYKLQSATLSGFVAFLISSLIAGMAIWRIDQASIDAAKSQASIDVADHANSVQAAIDRALSATYALGAMVKQGSGQISDFNAIAEKLLPYYPGVQSLQLAPDGIVSQIYPLAGNERAVGHNLFADPQRSKESLLAKESGLLTLAGPFPLIQGGIGAAGRLPVFRKVDGRDQEAFWGFAIALIRFPDVLRDTSIVRLRAHDHQYRLWKTDPNTSKVQIIATSESSNEALLDPIEYPLTTPNGIWHLSVTSKHGWRNHEQLAFNILMGALISLMIGWMFRQMVELRNNRLNLSRLVEERTSELSKEVVQRRLAQNISTTEALRLKTILETASDGIHIVDKDGILVEANKSFLSMLGYDASAIGKIHFKDWDVINDWEMVKVSNDQLSASGGTYVFETKHRRADGREIEVEINSTGIKIEGKSYLYAASRDITSRKQDEAKRNQLLEQLQRISEQVPGVIYQYLLRPDGTSCFPFASKAMEGIYRVNPSEVKEDASKVFDVMHPDDIVRVTNSIRTSAREMSLWREEYRVKFDDGAIIETSIIHDTTKAKPASSKRQ